MNTNPVPLLAAFAVVLLAAGGSRAAEPVAVTPAAAALIWDNHPVNGAGNASMKDALFAGRRTDVKPARLERAWFSFELPYLTPGTRLKSATLRLRVADTLGPVTGGVTLYHSIADNRTKWDGNNYTYENVTFASTGHTLGEEEIVKGRWVEIDVTAQVRDDYAKDGDRRVSAFRLQNDSLLSAEGSYSLVAFGVKGVAAPQLLITLSY